jgi:hypothetical protein
MANFKPYRNTEEVIADLNKHFKTVALEKYPDIMLEACMERAFLKESKNSNLGKYKISDNVRRRIIDYVVKELHSFYGEWVNLYNFDRKFRGHTNFRAVYKTEFGKLYGSQPGTYLDHLFFTSHCFEKFKERYDEEKFKYLKLAFQKIMSTNPNPADYLRVLTMNAMQFCETSQFIYVDVCYGILVIEKITEHLFIAKTYLNLDMNYPKENWQLCSFPAMMLHGGLRETWKEEPPELVGEHVTMDQEQIPCDICQGLITNLKNYPNLGY